MAARSSRSRACSSLRDRIASVPFSPEYYEYGSGNLVSYKRLHAPVLTIGNYTSSSPDIDAQFYYTNEGQLSGIRYPTAYSGGTPGWDWNFSYSFDTLGRPTGLTDQASVQWVSNVAYGGTYGPAGEMTAMKQLVSSVNHQWYNEARTFNVRGQLTRMTATGVADSGYTPPQTVDLQYNFSRTANDGRVTSCQDLISGATVNYTFDTLGRLTYANNTGTSPWSQAFGFDGFGNLLTETGSGGAPTKTLSVDPTTNRINSSGYSFDAAGNLTAMPGITSLVYDKNNRLSQATVAGGTEKYGYNPAGQRVWVLDTYGQYKVHFSGVNGELLATFYYNQGGLCYCTLGAGPYVYFAGKELKTVEDRLGSVGSYYPYGELQSGSAYKYATYRRQGATGLDYAQQRWYSSQVMRFTSPDPAAESAVAETPQSWNRYGYVEGDPVNRNDPDGLGPITALSCIGGNQAVLSVGGSGFACPGTNYSQIGQISGEMAVAYGKYQVDLGAAYDQIASENAAAKAKPPVGSAVTTSIDFGNGPQYTTTTVTMWTKVMQNAVTGSVGFFSQYLVGASVNVAYVPGSSSVCLGISVGLGTPGLTGGVGALTSDADVNVVEIVKGFSWSGSYSNPFKGGGQFSWTPGTGVANGPAWGTPGASFTGGVSGCVAVTP